MKKCKGCGEILQYTNKDLPGYAPSEDFDYCQRCFRLTHYGDTSKVNKEDTKNEDILKAYKEINDALFVIICDPFDALFLSEDNLLSCFKEKDVLLIINKIDLLPKNITEEKINKIYLESLKKYKEVNCLLTYKNDETFNDLFFEVLEQFKQKKIVFAGRANVGKSSLINKLLEDSVLTTSIYPGTTIKVNRINYKGYSFIDTAGLIDNESFLSHLSNNNVKKILPLKTLKRQMFQLYENQSYIINGLLRVDIKPAKNASIEFMVNNNLEVHRTKLENADRYFDRNCKDDKLRLLPLKSHKYKVDKFNTFYLKGLGVFKIKGKCDVDIKVNDDIKVYISEVNL